MMAKTLGELKTRGDRYTWVNYDKDAREELFACLDQAIENGYENILTNPAIEVATDLGDYAPEFEGIETSETVAWIEEWQKLNKHLIQENQ